MRVVIAAAVALCLSAPAAAEETGYAKSLEIGLQGEIAQHCAMGSVGNMDFGDITRAGLAATANVALSCNMPFNMTIKAQNGGLANSAYPNGQGPYSGKLPYQIAVALPLRSPTPLEVTRTFESRDLAGGRTISSDGAIAVDGMKLSVALGRPSGEARLLAGDYSETIEITIAPS